MALTLNFSSQRERTCWVQAQLKLKGQSFASIARTLGCNRATVSDAMNKASYPQERAIAAMLGVTAEQLFPERYDARGNRLHPVKSSSARQSHNVKESRVA